MRKPARRLILHLAPRAFDGGVNAELMLLKAALGPTGQIGVLMGDGSVRQIGGATGQVVAFETSWSRSRIGCLLSDPSGA